MNIAPLAPLIGVDGEKGFGALLGADRVEKSRGGFAYRLRRNTGLLNFKQTWNHGSVGGDPFERLRCRVE